VQPTTFARAPNRNSCISPSLQLIILVTTFRCRLALPIGERCGSMPEPCT
jgi:hypothetical protein